MIYFIIYVVILVPIPIDNLTFQKINDIYSMLPDFKRHIF